MSKREHGSGIDDLKAAHEICRNQTKADALVAAVGVGLSAARAEGYAAGLRQGFASGGYYVAAEVDGWVLVRRAGDHRGDQFMYDVRCIPQRDACDAPAAELLREAPE